jgi:hypothetical protein
MMTEIFAQGDPLLARACEIAAAIFSPSEPES